MSPGMTAPYRLAIFDFDGVLADSAPWMLRTLNRVAARFDFRQVSDEEIAMLRGRSNRDIIRYLRVPMWRLPGIARHVRSLSAAEADAIPLFDGVPQLFADLRAAGVQIAVVSSNAEPTVRRVLGAALAAQVARYDCGAALFGKAKVFRRVVRRLAVPPAAVLCIGDEIRDIEAAKAAGLACAAVTWGYATEAALAGAAPTRLATSVPELRAMLTGV